MHLIEVLINPIIIILRESHLQIFRLVITKRPLSNLQFVQN